MKGNKKVLFFTGILNPLLSGRKHSDKMHVETQEIELLIEGKGMHAIDEENIYFVGNNEIMKFNIDTKEIAEVGKFDGRMIKEFTKDIYGSSGGVESIEVVGSYIYSNFPHQEWS